MRRLFLSNNSSRTPEQVAAKLSGLGVAARPDEVLTSSLATASLLEREGFSGAAFVIGERGIRDALQSIGVRILEGQPDEADVVVVGFDGSVNYDELRTASLLVERGARLIATNADGSYPAPDGLWPGAGAILAVITTTTGATPTVVGKPARALFEAAAERTGATRPLVVGDRLDTDVRGAVGIRWDSLLVLTGATTRPDVLLGEDLPTYVAPDLSGLFQELPPGRFRAAGPGEVEGIREVLSSAGLTDEGVEGRLQDTLVSSEGGARRIDATACLQGIEEWAILRSVAVRKDLRGKGLGALAVAATVQEARRRGLRSVSLFTESASPFFEGLGFRRVDRDELPESVRTSRHAAEECAVSATPMVLALD
jgi:HAD superfamily hydrolase (TIGR01450 family)